jgi:nucleoside-diphosphate-sugar epimerase
VGDEGSPLSPASPYGVTKLCAENLVSAICNSYGIEFSIFRLFSVYGPGQRSDMGFNIFIDRILSRREIEIYGDGSQSRANTFVRDVAMGIIQGIESAKSGEVYNICGSEQKSVLEIIEIICDILGAKPTMKFLKPRRGDQIETKSVASKAFRDLGFIPITDLQTGLLEQVNWQKSLLLNQPREIFEGYKPIN